jgi:hypothetical protein
MPKHQKSQHFNVVDVRPRNIHQTEEGTVRITFRDREYEFVPWIPAMGRVFGGAFAFDTETTLIDSARPWLAPAYVLGAAFDGSRGVFITRNVLAEFFAAHADNVLVMHNAPFDLDVVTTAAPGENIYDRVERDRVFDTQIMHRLLTLGEHGHTAQGKDQSTLEHCAETYLGVKLTKDVRDSVGDSVRLSYAKWLNRPLGQMKSVYLHYLALDVITTFGAFRVLRSRPAKCILAERRGLSLTGDRPVS